MSLRSILILSSHLSLNLSSDTFHSDFRANLLSAFLFSPVHVIFPAYLMLLQFIILAIYDEEYKHLLILCVRNTITTF
jgi:hypothetical protein